MNRIILLILCLAIFNIASAQDSKSKRAAKKEARKIEKIARFNSLGLEIESKKFVLEIESIIYPSGTIRKKSPLQNNIWIDTDKCTWISESNDIPTDLMTMVSKVEGELDGWKFKRDIKHYRYFLEFRMFTDNGLYRVTVDFNPDRTYTGTISGTRDNFSFDGRFVKN